MRKTKLEFISELLDNHSIPPKHRERFLRLASAELKRNDDKVWNRIKGLEKEIKKFDAKANKDNSNGKSSQSYSPKDLAEFMSLFDDKEKLKYLTHDYDQSNEIFDIEKFLKKTETIFKETTKELNIKPNLWKVVNNFAFEKKLGEKNKEGNLIYWRGLDGKTIKEGWSRSRVTDEIKSRPKHKQEHPIGNDEFKNIIENFRRVTRIKSTEIDPQLTNILNEIIDEKELSDSKFDIELSPNLKKANFYCHVPSLKEAIGFIFDEMKEHGKRNIKVDCKRSNLDDYRTVEISLLQLDSYPSKDLKDMRQQLDSKTSKGGLGSIRNNLNGNCNYAIETRLDEKDVRFNILDDSEAKKEVEELDYKAEGFKHILTFFKK